MKGRSRVAYALAVGVAVSLVLLAAAILYAIADAQQELSAEASTLASAVLGGAVGALATYLGGGGKDDTDAPKDDIAPWPDDPPLP